MFNAIKRLSVACIITLVAVSQAHALPITGQLDIAGNVNLATSAFNAAGNADLESTGFVLIANGAFAGLAPGFASLQDIDFTNPGAIWSVGDFTFFAQAFSGFVDSSTKAFTAMGTIIGDGYDDTAGMLTFSAQTNGSAATVSFSSTTLPVAAVPEAGSFALLGLGLIGLVATRRRNQRG